MKNVERIICRVYCLKITLKLPVGQCTEPGDIIRVVRRVAFFRRHRDSTVDHIYIRTIIVLVDIYFFANHIFTRRARTNGFDCLDFLIVSITLTYIL